MRQSDGSDLQGVNAPADLGIIYVDPNDNPQSVLTAIQAEEKLDRKQIVIVLPSQGNSFRRPEDFDSIKRARHVLKAEIIFVMSSGSSPFEWARQRRFRAYSSLERFTKSLEDDAQISLPLGRFTKPLKDDTQNPVPALQRELKREEGIKQASNAGTRESQIPTTGKQGVNSFPFIENEQSFEFPLERIRGPIKEGRRRASLERLVAERMDELWRVQDFLAKRSQKLEKYATIAKTSVIILGTLIATKETLSTVIGSSNSINTISIVGYTLAGAIIAVLTGLEASFGWGAKSGKLAALAVICRETRQRVEFDQVTIAVQEDATANLALEKLLDRLQAKLQEVQNETVGFGLNPVGSVDSHSIPRKSVERVRRERRRKESEITRPLGSNAWGSPQSNQEA